VVTGVVLIAGGVAVLSDGDTLLAIVLSSLSLGMLTYPLIVSPGYYIERRNRPPKVVFAGFWVVTIPAIILRLVAPDQPRRSAHRPWQPRRVVLCHVAIAAPGAGSACEPRSGE
jgi:hypothetical protein